MTKWVQSIRQATTYLGLVVIAVVWSGVFLLGEQEHRRAYDEAVRQAFAIGRRDLAAGLFVQAPGSRAGD